MIPATLLGLGAEAWIVSAIVSPKWSPTGKSIAFSLEDPPITFDHGQIYTVRADGSHPMNLTNDAFDNAYPDWR